MNFLKKSIFWAVVLSETTHLFCCVLPTVVSVMGLLAGAGLVTAMPGFIGDFHDIIHAYEVPLIVISGVVLALGWGLYELSRRIDCHETGCAHGACAPRKDKTLLILSIATTLFTANLAIYWFLHAHHGVQDYIEEHYHPAAQGISP